MTDADNFIRGLVFEAMAKENGIGIVATEIIRSIEDDSKGIIEVNKEFHEFLVEVLNAVNDYPCNQSVNKNKIILNDGDRFDLLDFEEHK
jgi:hypothetical protein